MMLTMNDLKSNELSDMLMKQDMSISLSVTTLTKTDRFSNSLQFHAFVRTDLKQLHALCFNFLHLKQSSFLNNFSLTKSMFNILSFFHAKIEAEIAVVIIIKMLVIKRAT